jgi:riboflavin kinase / FMN adenylyltransferase
VPADRGTVLALGTFDGVHRGHRAVVDKAVRRAAALGLPCTVFSFRRPPRLFFSPRPGPVLITTPEEKEGHLKGLGAGRVLSPAFNRALAGLSAGDFLKRKVLGALKAREIVVGYDFRFGKGRGGDPEFLVREAGVPVHVVPPVRWRGQAVSSESVRDDLRAGRLAAANAKLGRPYSLTGRVARGDGRGRTLGYPTANLSVSPEKILPPGVYAVRATLPNGKTRGGMANIGVRPTLSRPDPQPTVEVHIFAFSGTLTGKTLRVEFIKRIRAERKFPSLEHLKRRLRLDATAARRALR